MNAYKIPDQTRIGHVHIKVADLERSLSFYRDLIGFEVMAIYDTQAAFHTAILYPTRKDLAVIFDRINKAKYPITGASDHGVSEALYLNDPDGNGVELCWDKPRDQWPKKEDGSLNMYVHPLDLHNLLNEIAKEQT